MVVTEKEEEEPEPCGLSRSSVEPTLLDHHLVKVLVIGDGDEGIEIFVGELVSQACEGQDEDEDWGSTACIDAKFNNIESMIYQSSAYINDKFCETFHSGRDGWRHCAVRRMPLHCGCIVSCHTYTELDYGGVGSTEDLL
ncbi:hypothetical protein CerSpe_116730 [Prunus speciosa]